MCLINVASVIESRFFDAASHVKEIYVTGNFLVNATQIKQLSPCGLNVPFMSSTAYEMCKKHM